MEDHDLAAKSAGMRHWLTHVSCLLTVVLGTWTSLSLATPTPRDRIHPLTRIVSHQQQQQTGSQALSLSTAYRRHPSLVIPRTIGKRDGIFIQELSSNFILHYRTFSVSISEKSWYSYDQIFPHENSEAIRTVHTFLPCKARLITRLTFPVFHPLVEYGTLARGILVQTRTAARRHP